MKTLAPKKEGILREYIRVEKRKPIGLVVGYINEDDDQLIGFSICHENDEWNKEIGYLVAWSRLTDDPLSLLDFHLPNGAKNYKRKRDVDRLRILRAVPYIQKMKERLRGRRFNA